MNNFKKDTLQYFNHYYEQYTVAILTKHVLNLPEYLYDEESIFLHIGETLIRPTGIQFHEDNNDDKVAFVGTHDLAKTVLFQIFILKFIYDPSIAKKSKPELRVIN